MEKSPLMVQLEEGVRLMDDIVAAYESLPEPWKSDWRSWQKEVVEERGKRRRQYSFLLKKLGVSEEEVV